MKILIDNTGFQSVDRMLGNKKYLLDDIKGLIQFCELLIFSENILVVNYDDNEVSQTNMDLAQRLSAIGISSEQLQIINGDHQVYYRAAKSAAENFAIDLTIANGFQEIQTHVSSLRPKGMESLDTQTSYINLISENINQSQVEGFKSEKATGIVHYLAATNDNFRNYLQDEIERDSNFKHNKSKLFQINAFLRYFLNNSLAYQYDANYTPSIGRAKLALTYAEQKKEILNYILMQGQVLGMIDEAFKKMILKPKLEIPSIARLLVSKSDGITEKMIEISLNYREKAKDLRNWLTQNSKKMMQNGGQAEGNIEVEFETLRKLFHQAVDKKTDLGKDAMQPLIPSISLSTPSVSGFKLALQISTDKLINCWKKKRHKKNINFLTEVIMDLRKSRKIIKDEDILRLFNRKH